VLSSPPPPRRQSKLASTCIFLIYSHSKPFIFIPSNQINKKVLNPDPCSHALFSFIIKKLAIPFDLNYLATTNSTMFASPALVDQHSALTSTSYTLPRAQFTRLRARPRRFHSNHRVVAVSNLNTFDSLFHFPPYMKFANTSKLTFCFPNNMSPCCRKLRLLQLHPSVILSAPTSPFSTKKSTVNLWSTLTTQPHHKNHKLSLMSSTNTTLAIIPTFIVACTLSLPKQPPLMKKLDRN
jgi:hypothetical protein